MIREAIASDLKMIKELVLVEAERLGVEKDSGIPVDPPTIDAVLRYHMRERDALVLVHEEEGIVDSFFVASFFPYYLDIRKKFAHEKISGGPKREELWEAFGEFAKKQGIAALVRGCYDSGEGSRFRKVT